MTRADARSVLKALATWEPVGTSIALTDVDRRNLREDVALKIAPALGFDEETALAIVGAARMAP